MIVMSRHGSAPLLRCAILLCGLLFCLYATLSSFARGAQADNKAVTASSSPTPVLIEMFTSEGCSSCPPVDGLLQKLDTFQPIPGAQLIVLSEHVTYWDQQGWKDPNSSSSLTDRQSSYEGVLGEKEVFTPQLIVDGTQQVHAGDPKQVKDTLQKAASAPKLGVRIGDVTVDAGNPTALRAHIETDANFDKKNADVFVAVALDHVESQVLRGENGGRHLIHVAVVQELTKVGKLPKGKSFSQDIQLKLKPGTDPKNLRLVALVQESGPGKVLGSALRKPAN
jgi:hypothetical protein